MIMVKRSFCLLLLFICMSLQSYASEGGAYSIQLGLFNHEPTANTFYQNLLQQGLPVFKVHNASHRIFYGLYKSRGEALNELEKARQYVRGAFVTQLSREQLKVAQSMMEADREEEAVVDVIDDISSEIEERIEIPKKDDSYGKNVYNYSFTRDIVFHGFHGVSSVFLKVYDEWSLLEGGFIRLLYSHSIPERYYGSSLTVLINNTPIYSTLFSSREQRVNELIVPLEPSMLQKGFNEIKITTYHRLTDDPCEDDRNPALWVRLRKDSFIHLRYEERLETHFTRDYPYPYVKEYLDEPVDFSFIIDEEQIEPSKIKAAHILAANIGQRVQYKNLELSVKGYEALKTMEEHFILLDTRVPPLLAPFFPEDFALLEERIYIGEKVIGHRNILYLLSKEPEDLVKAAKLLTNDLIIQQMPQALDISVERAEYIEHEEEQSQYHSLKDLGYESLLLSGGRTVSADFFMNYPKNWRIQEGAHFALKFSYSKAINFNNSTVTVLVNSIPIGNTLLRKEEASESILVYYLPREVLQDRAFHLQIRFFLDGDIDCRSSSDYSFLWSFISNESHLYLPYTQKREYDFKDFPSPFISDYRFQDFSIVLDPSASLEEITLSANIMAFMGNHLKGIGDFHVVMGEELPFGNTILIGTTEQPLVRATNHHLLVPYSESFRFFRRDRLLLLEEDANHLSVAQLLDKKDSPYAHLFLTGFSLDSLGWIGRFFHDSELHDTLAGNVAFVNSRGLLNTLYIGERPREGLRLLEEIERKRELPAPRETFEEIRNYLIVTGLVIIGVILFIVFYRRREGFR